MNKINRPNMVLILGTEANDRIVFVIKRLAFFVTFWKLQTFFTPILFNFLVINLPSFYAQKLRDFTRTITGILFSKMNKSQPERIIVVPVNDTILHR